ncbi:sulfate transport system substrate-binding protein thiosulfate-binding protein [Gloeomargarita lithophora Alchichica-D10]|uniref:Sulfate transport system substrate-binding protein thiosulfate-binding protein n=1 Tax=Gloeomargarita lithophora Alchichica-D10 TaxID=1188229 RepID=A0A1J0AAE7_9CYAN|nr:sulfate ABC transporter substrate-binding protein [Gloeomargarita lithophora]APB32902.1 sulfate transport system substrate-binding protein thiosulfate-binding protein [Gloeomargarita lithophora Alchichica-D10]
MGWGKWGAGLAAVVTGVAVAVLPGWLAQAQRGTELTLVSYAVAKPVFAKLIPEFQKQWQARTGQRVTFKESYGASGAQTRAILGGLEADILAQNIQSNIDPLVEKGFVRADWQKRLPNQAIPATSVMVLITRPGNPKNIRTWSDLTRPDVEVLLINPKTAGNARWGIMAGFGATQKSLGTAKAQEYLNRLVANTKVLANSGRDGTDKFVKNRIGDVTINFENEVIFLNESIPKDFPYVAPSPNLQTDFPVTVIDRTVDKRGTRRVAEAFTQFLFSPKGQEIYAEAGYRPVDPQVRQRFVKNFQNVNRIYKISDFGGWGKVNALLFADGALFDQVQRTAAQRR